MIVNKFINYDFLNKNYVNFWIKFIHLKILADSLVDDGYLLIIEHLYNDKM